MLQQPVPRQKHRDDFYLAPTPAAAGGNQGSNFLCNAHSADIFELLLLHVLFLTEITAPGKSQTCEFQDRVLCLAGT